MARTKRRAARRSLPAVQNTAFDGWSLGYVSEQREGGTPITAFSDMTNWDMTLSNLPFIRNGIVPYGAPYLGTCIGAGTFYKKVSGKRLSYEISAQVIGGVTKICIAKDGEPWTIVPGSYTFDTTAWISFAFTNKRVKIMNGVDEYSYYDVDTNTIVEFTEILPPSAPTATPSGLTGTAWTYYIAVTAINSVTETNASAITSFTVSDPREFWDGVTKKAVYSWSAVAGATDGYAIYLGTSSADLYWLTTVPAGTTSFTDDGRSQAQVTKRAPTINATKGPKLKYGVGIGGQFFGWGDPEHEELVWYDGGAAGIEGDSNFTINAGGGYVGVDQDGPSVPVSVVPFRTGKGDYAPLILTRGPAGEGVPLHLTFSPETIGDLTALMPVLTPANGNFGATSPLAVALCNDAVHFLAGHRFAYEGNAPNIPNILSAKSSSDYIQPDCDQINLAAIDKAWAVEWQGRIIWGIPRLSNEVSELWILDLRPERQARWILPWTIPAKYGYKYEDNTGRSRVILIVNNKRMTFSDSPGSTDDGIPFRTRLASGPIIYNDAGTAVNHTEYVRLMAQDPKGYITGRVTGEGLKGKIDESESLDIPATPSNTAIGQFEFGTSEFGQDPLFTDTDTPSVQPIKIAIKTMNYLLRWVVETKTAGCRVMIKSAETQGIPIPNIYAGD